MRPHKGPKPHHPLSAHEKLAERETDGVRSARPPAQGCRGRSPMPGGLGVSPKVFLPPPSPARGRGRGPGGG